MVSISVFNTGFSYVLLFAKTKCTTAVLCLRVVISFNAKLRNPVWQCCSDETRLQGYNVSVNSERNVLKNR